MDATVTPLPTEETTPPVQKRYFVTLTSLSDFREIGDSVDRGFPAKAAPTPVLSGAEGSPVRGHGSPLCSKIVSY